MRRIGYKWFLISLILVSCGWGESTEPTSNDTNTTKECSDDPLERMLTGKPACAKNKGKK